MRRRAARYYLDGLDLYGARLISSLSRALPTSRTAYNYPRAIAAEDFDSVSQIPFILASKHLQKRQILIDANSRSSTASPINNALRTALGALNVPTRARTFLEQQGNFVQCVCARL